MRPPRLSRLLGRVCVLAIRVYQWTLSPLLGGQCRFSPTCSQYALDAFGLHPPLRAAWLTLRRLARCQPLARGGYDPVPIPDKPSQHAPTSPAGAPAGRRADTPGSGRADTRGLGRADTPGSSDG